MEKFYFLLAVIFFVCYSFYSNAQIVNVSSTIGGFATYPNLGEAIDAINVGTHRGIIDVVLLDSTIEPNMVCLLASGDSGASYTSINIKPDPSVLGLIYVVGNDTATLQLCGADNVTISDLGIKNIKTSPPSCAIWIASGSSAEDSLGAKHNTIRNCEISCGLRTDTTSAGSSFGIFAGGTPIELMRQGRNNDSNQFIGNRIVRCVYGINVIGGGVANNNDNNMIIGNIIGPTSHGPDQIRNIGIHVQFQTNCTISQNLIQYVGGPISQNLVGGDRIGIAIGSFSWGATPTTTTGGNYIVTRNKINNILEERTFSAIGILCATTRSGLNTNNLIANNEIYNIKANGTLGDEALGIAHNGNNSGDRIVYNSIYMEGDLDPPGTMSAAQTCGGIRIATLADSNTTVKNNSIYVNLTSNIATLLKVCIQMPAAAYQFGSASLNNNDYFIPDTLGKRIGGLGTTGLATTFFPTLAAWQAAFTSPRDSNSISADPVYCLGGPNYLIPCLIISPLKMNASPIAGITIDILGEIRSSSLPTIGAYEFDSITLPVDLTALTATVINRRDVRLNWVTALEINNSGFDIERRDARGETQNAWSKVGFVQGNGTSSTSNNYSFTDKGLNTGKYNYRLKQIDYNGNFEYFNLSNYIEIGVPSVYNLSQNYPNPFNPITKIDYDIPYDGKVNIVLYDISGREVTTLVNDVQAAGYYYIHFNGSNFASGAYFYRMEVEGVKQFVMTKRMVLIK